MNDTYTFPNTEAGRDLRIELVDGLIRCGIAFFEYTEDVKGTVGGAVLKLEITGKRPGAGRIARDMKERQS